MKRKKKQQQSQSSWLLIPFWLLSQRLVCSRTPNQSLQSKRASLLASLVELRSRLHVRRCCSFVAILIAIEHAKVHRNSRCMWTCSFARFVTIDVFVRDHHRDRHTRLQNSLRLSWNTRCDHARDRTIELSTSCDHVHDRTILSGPSRPSSWLDVQRAHWS